ncbi:MAG: hypothetical protein ACRCY3_03865 [Sphingorhabdus sp.]
MQNSQINGPDRMQATHAAHRTVFANLADIRLNEARSLSLQPTAPLSPALLRPTLTGTVANQIPWQEAQAYRQPEASVSFSAPESFAQTSSTSLPSCTSTRELALLAADVYRDTAAPPAGYRVATDGDLAKLGLNPADLTSTQSPFRARVYVKGSGDDAQHIVAFRGTTGGGDWSTNFRQGIGLSSDHYRRALHIGSKLALAGDANVVVTGHSLGGGLASAAAIASGRQAATFNAAGLSDATIDSARSIRTSAGVTTTENVSAYYVRGEVLSALQDGGDRLLGRALGGLVGAAVVDAPEAYGNRIALDAVRPEGLRWYQDNAVARHGMDWVLSSLAR